MLTAGKPLRLKPLYLDATRWTIHLVASVWLALVFWSGITGNLPGDPVQYLTDFTGISAFNLLLLSLCVSPISERLKFAQLMQLRKTLGVYAAVYALSHLMVFIIFELQYEWGLIIEEIVKRPYIGVGFLALVILSALLLTSTQFAKQKLGKTWHKLHRWVYLALLLICLHFIWSIKAEELAPYVYIGLSLILLTLRWKKIRTFFK